MKRFIATWWASLWVGGCALTFTIAVLAGGRVYPWEAIVWAGNATAWTVLAEVRYRTGRLKGQLDERERQGAWWH